MLYICRGYQNFDFSKLDSFVHQLKGSSSRLIYISTYSASYDSLICAMTICPFNFFCIWSLISIGAHRLKLACVNLREASDDRNKEGWETPPRSSFQMFIPQSYAIWLLSAIVGIYVYRLISFLSYIHLFMCNVLKISA